MFEASGDHGVVTAQETQGVVVRMLQQEAQTEAMVTLVLGGDSQLRWRKNILDICFISQKQPHEQE